MTFLKLASLENRLAESTRIREKYPDRVPVIVERSEKCAKDIPIINRSKYLVPMNMTVGQFICVIRKRVNMDGNKALFIYTNQNVLPCVGALMGTLFESHMDEDGFLYIKYSGENTFGFIL
jgi:GABA(A) receptor-associated protein